MQTALNETPKMVIDQIADMTSCEACNVCETLHGQVLPFSEGFLDYDLFDGRREVAWQLPGSASTERGVVSGENETV